MKIRMRCLTKILIAGTFIGGVAIGYYGKEFVETFGKYDCIYNRSMQMSDVQRDSKGSMSSNEDASARQTTMNYIVTGKCDFDFSKLKENRE